MDNEVPPPPLEQEDLVRSLDLIFQNLKKLKKDREFWEKEALRNKEAAVEWYQELETYKRMYSELLEKYDGLSNVR